MQTHLRLTIIAISFVLLVANIACADDERAAPSADTIRSETRLYRTAPEGELFLHLYFPPGWKKTDARPAIVFFFGGGWKTGSYKQFTRQAEYFASRGLVAASADYRIKNRHRTTPVESVEDAKSAVRWLRSHARELGVDPDKIIAGGGSAGGHLAASTAMLDDINAPDDDTSISAHPCALVLFNPVVDLTIVPKKISGQTAAGAVSKELRAKLSPALRLSKSSPPTIMFFGSEDHWFPQGKEFPAKAAAFGVRAELYVADGEKHGFFNRSPWTEVTLKKADEFLISLGYLDGKPTVVVPAGAGRLRDAKAEGGGGKAEGEEG